MGFAQQEVEKCDGKNGANLNGWYRMMGKAGDQIPDKCVPSRRCGTLATGWLNGEHPSVKELVVTREVCWHWEDDCCRFKSHVQVRNCGDFYVYGLPPAPTCVMRYCGNKDIGMKLNYSKPSWQLRLIQTLLKSNDINLFLMHEPPL